MLPAAPMPRRTRLSPERAGELYEAVIDLLREVGYEALTMDAVAARSHSSKATLYRQWQSKPQLVAAAMRAARPFAFEEIDTGTLRGDLHLFARQVGAVAEQDTELLRALAHAVHGNRDLAVAVRETVVEPEKDTLVALLDRAVARGEVAADTPALRFLPHMLLGALMTRPLLEERMADGAYLFAYMEAVVLPALGQD
jgi:AcrR family transcriptional regulator